MTRHSLGYFLSERAKKERALKHNPTISNVGVKNTTEHPQPSSVSFEIVDRPTDINGSEEAPILTSNVSNDESITSENTDSVTILNSPQEKENNPEQETIQ